MHSSRPLFGLRSISLLAGSAVVAGVAVTAGASALAPAAATLSTVRINVGGPALTDINGNKWSADSYYVGGKVSSTSANIQGAAKQYVFRDERYAMSAYHIPVVNGTYKVNLLEAETYFGAAGKRVFSVTAEGQTVAKNVDIFKLAGGKDVAYWIKFTTTVTDGKLDLGFTASVNYAQVNGIVVQPAVTSTPSPTPTTAAPSPTPSATATAAPIPSPSTSPTPSTSSS
jgi:hypothetical protein